MGSVEFLWIVYNKVNFNYFDSFTSKESALIRVRELNDEVESDCFGLYQIPVSYFHNILIQWLSKILFK